MLMLTEVKDVVGDMLINTNTTTALRVYNMHIQIKLLQ